jgi:hypothetical protein
MGGLLLRGNFEVMFRELQKRYVVQFGILRPTEHVSEQKITAEKTLSTWLEVELTGCIPTFRRKSDLKSTQKLEAVTTSRVDSLLNISVFSLHKCSYLFLLDGYYCAYIRFVL